MNHQRYKEFKHGERRRLLFEECRRYRLGPTNDEGWFAGECRFCGIVPKWGQFYEVSGDLKLNECPNDWIEVGGGSGSCHYLFYFRDETFECDADSFTFTTVGET